MDMQLSFFFDKSYLCYRKRGQDTTQHITITTTADIIQGGTGIIPQADMTLRIRIPTLDTYNVMKRDISSVEREIVYMDADVLNIFYSSFDSSVLSVFDSKHVK